MTATRSGRSSGFRTLSLIIGSGLFIGACSPAKNQTTEPVVLAAPPTVGTGAAAAPPTVTPPDEPSPTGSCSHSYPYANSSITDFACKVTDIAFAALRGKPLPNNGIAIERLPRGRSLVRKRDAVPARLDVVAFIAEMDILLGLSKKASNSRAGRSRNRTLRTALYLSSTGLKLAHLRVSSAIRAYPLAPEVKGFEPVAKDLIKALRANRLKRWLISETERPGFGNDALFRELIDEAPKTRVIRDVRDMLKTWNEPEEYRFDDLVILVRGPDRRIYNLRLDVEHHRHGMELDSRPLVYFKQVYRF